MRPPNVVEYMSEQAVERLNEDTVAKRQQDRALLRIINTVLALNHEGIDISNNALMVLVLVHLTPGIGVSQIAENLHLSPGGVSKIIDQLSIGRMVRGQRQSGLGLIKREIGQGCLLTTEGQRIVNLIAKVSEE